MTRDDQAIGTWRSRLLGGPLSAFGDIQNEMVGELTEQTSKPPLTRKETEGVVGGTNVEQTWNKPPVGQRCVAVGCSEPLADAYYCASHRAAVTDPPVLVCVFCVEPLAPGDTIACVTHRAAINAEPMPWDKPAPADTAPRCHGCGDVLGRERLTLPRAKSGDLVFCSFACQECWRSVGIAS